LWLKKNLNNKPLTIPYQLYIAFYLNHSSADVALWEYHVEDPTYMMLLKLKWRTYHVCSVPHPDEVCCTIHNTLIDIVKQ